MSGRRWLWFVVTVPVGYATQRWPAYTSSWYLLLFLPLLSACLPSQQGPERVHLKMTYDPTAASWSQGEGENTIEGSGLLRTRGGEVRTCAGLTVQLVPVTVYAKERMMHLFGNVRGGFRSVDQELEFLPESNAFHESARVTKCDPQGAFSFDDLPDGEWFLLTTIVWEVLTKLWSDSVVRSYQGGLLMQRVKARGGEVEKAVLSY
jgi:hypothetical protein